MSLKNLVALALCLALCLAQSAEEPTAAPSTSLDWIGLAVIIVFYVLIVFVSIWAGKKKKDESTTEMVLAGRSISGVVGVITMVASWICAGYLYGTVQAIVDGGLVWSEATWCYSVCFLFAGLLFVKKMREREYVTMLDPFQEKYGPVMTALLYIPTVLGDIFWLAMTLATLGSALSFLLNIPIIIAIIVSAVFAAIYTFIGGLYAVVYIDVIQLTIMVVCMWIAIPFIWTNDKVDDVSLHTSEWLGSVEGSANWGIWVDSALLMCFGGIPWQVVFQRVLACKSVKDAKQLSYLSAIGVAIVAIAPCILGIIAVSTRWEEIPEVGTIADKSSSALSYLIKYLCPQVVSYIGLGALAAATMSTTDSAMLASATVFSINIYKPIIHKKASDRETMIVARIMVFVIAAIAVVLAITSQSVYDLWVMTSDYIYCILFPQLFLILYFPYCNTYGSFVGYIVAVILRLGGGEPLFKLDAFIPYPEWMPFRTLAMVCSLIAIMLFSYLFYYLIEVKKCNIDFLGFYRPQIPVSTPKEKTVAPEATAPVEPETAPAEPETKPVDVPVITEAPVVVEAVPAESDAKPVDVPVITEAPVVVEAVAQPAN